MIGTKVRTIVRVLPSNTALGMYGMPMRNEAFYELTDLPWDEQNKIREDLGKQGYLVQAVYLDDLMPLQVGLEIRRKETERLAKEKDTR